jgi:hypothetical protein
MSLILWVLSGRQWALSTSAAGLKWLDYIFRWVTLPNIGFSLFEKPLQWIVRRVVQAAVASSLGGGRRNGVKKFRSMVCRILGNSNW